MSWSLSWAQHLLGGELEHGVDPRVDHIPLELDQGLDQLKPTAETFSNDLGNDHPESNSQHSHVHFRLNILIDSNISDQIMTFATG